MGQFISNLKNKEGSDVNIDFEGNKHQSTNRKSEINTNPILLNNNTYFTS